MDSPFSLRNLIVFFLLVCCIVPSCDGFPAPRSHPVAWLRGMTKLAVRQGHRPAPSRPQSPSVVQPKVPRRATSTPEKLLGNLTVSVQMGSQLQSLDMIIDSTNCWSWTATTKCANCAKTFDQSKSSTYLELGSTVSEQYYEIGTFRGYVSAVSASDSMNIAGVKRPAAKFLAVTTEEGKAFSGFSAHGSIGLNRYAFTQSCGLVKQLYAAGNISAPVVGLSMATATAKRTEMTLGGLDSSKYTSLAKFKSWLPNGIWGINVTYLGYGVDSAKSIYTAADTLGLVWLNTHYLMIPWDIFEPIFNVMVTSTGSCSRDPQTFTISCEGKTLTYDMFSPLAFLMVNNQTFTVPVENYVTIVKQGSGDSATYYATVNVTTPPGAMYIGLGTAFWRQYYLSLETDSNDVGWVGIGVSGSSADSSTSGWVIIVAIVLAIVIVSGGAASLVIWYRKHHVRQATEKSSTAGKLDIEPENIVSSTSAGPVAEEKKEEKEEEEEEEEEVEAVEDQGKEKLVLSS